MNVAAVQADQEWRRWLRQLIPSIRDPSIKEDCSSLSSPSRRSATWWTCREIVEVIIQIVTVVKQLVAAVPAVAESVRMWLYGFGATVPPPLEPLRQLVASPSAGALRCRRVLLQRTCPITRAFVRCVNLISSRWALFC